MRPSEVYCSGSRIDVDRERFSAKVSPYGSRRELKSFYISSWDCILIAVPVFSVWILLQAIATTILSAFFA
jgi:hypothetical protein